MTSAVVRAPMKVFVATRDPALSSAKESKRGPIYLPFDRTFLDPSLCEKDTMVVSKDALDLGMWITHEWSIGRFQALTIADFETATTDFAVRLHRIAGQIHFDGAGSDLSPLDLLTRGQYAWQLVGGYAKARSQQRSDASKTRARERTERGLLNGRPPKSQNSTKSTVHSESESAQRSCPKCGCDMVSLGRREVCPNLNCT